MPSAEVPEPRSHAVMSPLNTDAPLNMLLVDVTPRTSQRDRPLP